MKPDAFLLACPSRDVLGRVSEKWAALALVALADGPMRFNAIRRRLEGVSQKMLTQTLRRMERDGLVKRTVVDERPLRVDYELLPAGKSLLPLLSALKGWAERHLNGVLKANATFDAKYAGRNGRRKQR
jgi:DNA-binding HxlR family transcriptional regulator